ncbi:MAG: alkaline phosphatase D family protein [Deltaproteobacteria bacterium]|nr:alkaline phosphatase D family protein [Deltaproteobacteria bacterium]
MKRREFLRRSGWFVAGAALAGIPGCGDNAVVKADAGLPSGLYKFPQGVASGDPRETSVVIWTRVEAVDGGTGPIALTVEVSSDALFGTVVVHQVVSATDASDHTVRVLITGLGPATDYYYRFIAGADTIRGRTRTAPAASADVQVNLAWVSCQDYSAGTYGAYRQMLIDDAARDAADQIHAVVHLGDVIYETIGGGFQVPLDANFTATTVANLDGTPRTLGAFPSGGGSVTGGDGKYARTVDDYRHLYKSFFTDPDLQAARARWPFIHTWDDHEFTDDCWQSQANYTPSKSLDEPSQTRRVAANQAWFEYIPVQLTGSAGVSGVPSEAKDFAPATVTDAAFTAANNDNFVDEPNNTAAIDSITIYRSLRFGKHVELVMTDERAYRSDHALPEDTTFGQVLFFNPRNVLPLQMVNIFDEGKTANGGNPPATVLNIPNPRATAPVGTMLGKDQKAWWKATMKGSDATWKLWGNEVPLMRFFIKKDPVPLLFADRVMDADAWDGYPTERKELMTYLKDEAIKNVVAITGDIHAHFAGVVMDDFDAASPTPVAVELIAAGISSNSLYSFYESATKTQPADLRNLIACDASAAGGAKFTESINLLLQWGTAAAKKFGETKVLADAEALKEAVNPHLKYADSNAQGYGYIKVTEAEVTGTLVTIERPIVQTGTDGPGVKRAATFTVPKDDPGAMSGPDIVGTKPYPLA